MHSDKDYITFRDNLTKLFQIDHPFPNVMCTEHLPVFIEYITKKSSEHRKNNPSLKSKKRFETVEETKEWESRKKESEYFLLLLTVLKRKNSHFKCIKN